MRRQEKRLDLRIRLAARYPAHCPPAGAQAVLLQHAAGRDSTPRTTRGVVGAADAGHAQRVGAQDPGVDDDRVDLVQPAQTFRPQRQYRVLIGQSAAQGRGECLGRGPAGFGGGYLHRGGGHGQVAGARADRPGAERLQERETTRGPLDGSGRLRPRHRFFWVHPRLVGVPRQLRFVVRPALGLRADLGGFHRLHGQPQRQ